MEEQARQKKARVRSPNYPGYSLERCLELVSVLYENFKRTSNAFAVVTKGIGFSPTSSSGLQVMASLSYYGLINIEGTGINRRISISDLAYKIIIDKRPESKDRESAIKEAALNPAFFKKIKEFYKNQIPNDSSLEWDLTSKFKFNPGTVKEFIRVYKDTMDFAKVYENDIISGDQTLPEESIMNEDVKPDGVKSGQNIVSSRPSGPIGSSSGLEIGNYLVGQNVWVRLIASGTLTQKSIDKLIKFLTMNKEDFPLEGDKKEN